MTKEEIKASPTGLRFNEGKARWSLMHYKSMEPMIRVLMVGAEKYTVSYDLEINQLFQLCQKSEFVITAIDTQELWQKICAIPATIKPVCLSQNVQGAERIDRLSQWICAQLATKPTDLKNQPTLQKNVEPILKTTVVEKGLPREKNSGVPNGEVSTGTMIEESIQTCLDDCLNMDSVRAFTAKNLKKAVQYAEVLKTPTSTIIIRLENTEVFFVVNAIKELDYLETVLKLLKRLSLISNDITIINNKIVVPGTNNWMKGLNKKEILECLQRHLASLMDGEELDPESGLPHIGHVMCNAMFYSYFSLPENLNKVR